MTAASDRAALIPHKVGTADIANPELKRVAMLFMENFTALAARVAELRSAVRELQKGGR